jgi:hypothetical protein
MSQKTVMAHAFLIMAGRFLDPHGGSCRPMARISRPLIRPFWVIGPAATQV